MSDCRCLAADYMKDESASALDLAAVLRLLAKVCYPTVCGCPAKVNFFVTGSLVRRQTAAFHGHPCGGWLFRIIFHELQAAFLDTAICSVPSILRIIAPPGILRLQCGCDGNRFILRTNSTTSILHPVCAH